MATLADEGFTMPAEWAPHDRCWMAWPCREALWGEHLDAAREATAEVARAIAAFEPVTMTANPESVAEVSLRCGAGYIIAQSGPEATKIAMLCAGHGCARHRHP